MHLDFIYNLLIRIAKNLSLVVLVVKVLTKSTQVNGETASPPGQFTALQASNAFKGKISG